MIKAIVVSCFIAGIIVFITAFVSAFAMDKILKEYEERKRNERTKKN